MGLLSLFQINILKERADHIKNLAQELNAEYFFGTDSIKDKFFVDWSYCCNKEGNVIVGKIEGYDYYIIEYPIFKYNKIRGGYWVKESRFVIKSKKNLPDFYLIPKTDLTFFVFLGIICGTFLICSLPIFAAIEEPNPRVWLYVLPFVAMVATILYFAFCHCTGYSYQGKYKINNEDFKNKFIIKNFSDYKQAGSFFKKTDPKKIREILTDDVCAELAEDYMNIFLSVRNNCVSDLGEENMETLQPHRQLTSSDSCKYRLEELLDIVKLLEHSTSNKTKETISIDSSFSSQTLINTNPNNYKTNNTKFNNKRLTYNNSKTNNKIKAKNKNAFKKSKRLKNRHR